MRKALIAEELIALAATRCRAESIAGDLTEEAQRRGVLWFSGALAGVCLAMFFQAFGLSRARTLAMLALGLVVWLVLYAGTRIGGAVLGLHPLVIDTADLTALPAPTLAYLCATLALSNTLAGIGLGWFGARLGGISPIMPLAAFWLVVAVTAPCLELASGTATWYCTLIYVLGVPMLYVAPLLTGGAWAAHRAAAPRLGISR